MSMDTEFSKHLLKLSKQQLREKVGRDVAKVLLDKHIDVVGSSGTYFRHWVSMPEIGLENDIYHEGRASCINEARSQAINDLLRHLFPEEEF